MSIRPKVLEGNRQKILRSTLITRRLSPFLKAGGALPDEQHGFRADRSTHTACKILKDGVDSVLEKPRLSWSSDEHSEPHQCHSATELTLDRWLLIWQSLIE